VPVTLQTFFVLVAGAALGPSLATVALSSYLVLGTVGLPLFAGGWLGPTTGYLVGFVPAGWAIARIVRAGKGASTVRLVAAMALGTAIIYACGGGWLVALGLPPRQALLQGVVVFLPGDLVKLAAAAAFCRSYRRRLRQLFP
jgi:biotin transport system substrate-specific component